MRISSVSMLIGRNLSTKKNQNNQNLNFGMIDPAHRNEIIANVYKGGHPTLKKLVVGALDSCDGIILKLGSKASQGKVFAELIPDHVKKSAGKQYYEQMKGKSKATSCLHHLEEEEQALNLCDLANMARDAEYKAEHGTQEDYDPDEDWEDRIDRFVHHRW